MALGVKCQGGADLEVVDVICWLDQEVDIPGTGGEGETGWAGVGSFCSVFACVRVCVCVWG